MDGVLTDFEQQFKDHYTWSPKQYIDKNGKNEFWKAVDELGLPFWEQMQWMPEGKKLWEAIKDKNVEILSSPSQSETSRIGKRNWVRFNICGTKLTLCHSSRKQYFAEPYAILIDDRKDTINAWNERGGVGILFESTDQVLDKLRHLKVI